MEEQTQQLSTRRHLYVELEKTMGIPVISFFTSFRYPVSLEDSDADMLEALLQKCDLPNGFALMLSSPGGSGLAAERIINVCRSYSGTGEYTVIVPGKAKSAATMICLGASKIIMGKTSELGTIDPQVIVKEDDHVKRFSVYNLLNSYENLFKRAIKEKGNLQPYLQQLQNYDEREIAKYKSALELSEDIAIKALKAGMLSGLPPVTIRNRIGIFLVPEKKAKVHGRAIYAAEASRVLDTSEHSNIEIKDVRETFWSTVYELYVRLNNFVSTGNRAKCIESTRYSFKAPVSPKMR